MDIKKMQSILMEKGIRISDDDPVFVFIALNEMVLDDITKKHQEILNGVDERVVGKLSAIVNQTVSQIAGKEAEARAATAITKKTIWMIGGVLVGMAMFAFGMGYGAIYSTWTNPAWIDRNGLLAVISSALLKTPVGGIGFIAIALTLFLLQKALTNMATENEEDQESSKTYMRIFIYLFAMAFAVTGFWLCFLMMFK